MREALRRAAHFAAHRHGLNRLLRYHPVHYPRARATIVEMAKRDGRGRRALQAELLRSLLAAARRAPYGRGRSADVADWPILERDAVRAMPRAFVASRWPGVPASTSGASGIPLSLARSLSSIAAEQAFLDSLLRPFGLSFRESRIAVLRGEIVKDSADPSPPFWKYRGPRHLVLSYSHLHPGTFAEYLEELLRFRPHVLWIYPTSGDLLAGWIRGHGAELRVPAVLSSSEALTPAVRARLEATFEGAVVDYHGQAERSSFSWQTRHGEAWFDPAYGFVELVPVPPSRGDDPRERVVEVVATGFWNSAMPLVRYRTGDYLALPADPAAVSLEGIALGLEPFARWHGRSTEYLVTPEGARIQGLNNVAANAERVLQVQYLQDSRDAVEIRVRPGPGYTTADGEKLIRETRRFLPPSVSLTVVCDAPLRRTASEKTPFLIRTVS